MLHQGFVALVTFLVVVDPPGVAPMFAALTHGEPAAWRRRMAIKAVAIAAVILVGFAFAGGPLLNAIGVSLDAFRLAGGLLLFLIALEMVFERRQTRREHRTQEAQAEHADHPPAEPDDISVFPLAMPLLAGPGAIATVLLYMTSDNLTVGEQAITLAALAVVLALCLAAFLLADAIMRILGKTASSAISRVLGLVLAALAAQFVLDALRNTLAGVAAA